MRRLISWAFGLLCFSHYAVARAIRSAGGETAGLPRWLSEYQQQSGKRLFSRATPRPNLDLDKEFGLDLKEFGLDLDEGFGLHDKFWEGVFGGRWTPQQPHSGQQQQHQHQVQQKPLGSEVSSDRLKSFEEFSNAHKNAGRASIDKGGRRRKYRPTNSSPGPHDKPLPDPFSHINELFTHDEKPRADDSPLNFSRIARTRDESYSKNGPTSDLDDIWKNSFSYAEMMKAFSPPPDSPLPPGGQLAKTHPPPQNRETRSELPPDPNNPHRDSSRGSPGDTHPPSPPPPPPRRRRHRYHGPKTESMVANLGKASNQGLLSSALGDSKPSIEASWNDPLQFHWEIRKIHVTREDRPPWQDILERWGPADLKPGSFYNITVKKTSENVMVVNAAIYLDLGLMVIKNPREASQDSLYPMIGDIYFRCLRYVQQVSGASTFIISQVLMVGLDPVTTTGKFTEAFRTQALAAHPHIDALYIPRVTSRSDRVGKMDSWFLTAMDTGAVVAISDLLRKHPGEMQQRIIEAFYVGSVQGYLLINLVKVSVSISAKTW